MPQYDARGQRVDPSITKALFHSWGSADPMQLGGKEQHSVIVMFGTGLWNWLFANVGQGRLYPPVGFFSVYAHGRPRGVLDERGGLIAASELAVRIKRHRRYTPSMHVVLLSCRVGQGPFPQELANLLRTEVIASPDRVLAAFGTHTTLAARWPPVGANWLRWRPGPRPRPVPRDFDPDGLVFSTGVEG